MKVTDNQGSEKKTTSTIDLVSDLKLPNDVKTKIKQDVGDYLIESILTSVGHAESPIDGESWPALNKEYRKKKVEAGSSPIPNMELSGDMLDSLTYKNTRDGIELGFIGTKEAWKADGHLKFSGEENNTPQRRFLPAAGQEFTSKIQQGIERIIADNIAEASVIDNAKLERVSTKADLYTLLSNSFPGLTRAEIKSATLRSVSMSELLAEYDLLDLL